MLEQLEDQYFAEDYSNEAVVGKALKNNDMLLGTMGNNVLENQYRIMQLQEQAQIMVNS